MKKLNKKGFTLIELLAVIVILGLLMAIAIPSVTRYINQSRKKTLVTSINSFADEVVNSVNNKDFGSLYDPSKLYYIRVAGTESGKNVSCISLEKGGSDPFGDWGEAYVAVHYNPVKSGFDYYFTFYDSAGYGMALTEVNTINSSGSDITNPTNITTTNIATQKTTKSMTGNISYTDAAGESKTVETYVINPDANGACDVAKAVKK